MKISSENQQPDDYVSYNKILDAKRKEDQELG